MKSQIAALAILGALTGTALAQTDPPPKRGLLSKSPFFSTRNAQANEPAGTAGAKDSKVFPSATSLPEPTPVDELKAPSMSLPDDPIEPWLLTKQAGPFMVLAKTFRGPASEKMALALAKELHERHGLPAYILRSKDFPGRSKMWGTPPTADPAVVQAAVKMPEKVRTYDEAAVLVGDEKTEQDAIQLLHKVKKIKPDCLNAMPSLFKWREGLNTALRTTNPYVPAQMLFPRKQDHLIVQMNQSARSIAHCPGRYSLQIAEFSGRSTFNDRDERFLLVNLKKSPLATAAVDAERLADKLAKDPDFRRLGQPIYVYHDRRASRVFVGSFNAEMDPAAIDVRDTLLKLAVPLMDRKRASGGLDTMIVPAGMLTELSDIKSNFKS